MMKAATQSHIHIYVSLSLFYIATLCNGQEPVCDNSPCLYGGSCINTATQPYYRCDCAAGYTGSTCSEDFDECVFQSPCLNGGFCVNNFGAYECHCSPSWEGRQCEILVKKCAAYPCSNEATCTDVGDDYLCTCQAGYTGNDCESDINECLELSPCQNGALCNNTVGSYICLCIAGYQGIDCEIETDECNALSPCNNNATCTDLVNGYACICQPGFTGIHCSTPSGECDGVPCLYGSCATDSDSSDIVCRCRAGYTGTFCDVDIQECVSSPCIYGDCVDRLDGYLCYCWSGYEGDTCNVNIDDCQNNDCVQGSTCVDGVNGFTCQCAAGYTGVDCSVDIDECSLYVPCQNGASCEHGIDWYICSCVSGYTGVNCSTDIDDCILDPCGEYGTCVDRAPGFHCNCEPGFTGDACDMNIDECESSPCNNNASCLDGINSYTCQCMAGFNGTHCEIDEDNCVDRDCNNGVCVDGVDHFTCLCTEGYTGTRCETEINECLTLQPCHNNSTCVDMINSYICQCVAGYSGLRCEEEIDACIEEPCQNGARCERTRGGQYSCVCVQGWTGIDCEVEIDECLDFSPCQNNATCEDLIGDYRCHCSPGFNGTRCEINTNECSSSPCHYLATCVDLQNSYQCLCAPGFSGVNCDIDIDECEENPCLYAGNCTQGKPGSYRCSCTPGISGSHCEMVDSVYMQPSGYTIIPVSDVLRDGVMMLTLTYRTYTYNAVLLSVTETTSSAQPMLLLLELIGSDIRLVLETGSDRVTLTQRRAGNRIQIIIGNNGVALSQPPSVFTEDSYINDTAGFLQSLSSLTLGKPCNTTSHLIYNTRSTGEYQGCVGNLTINNERINLNGSVTRGQLGCPASSGCPADYCLHDGICIESWDTQPSCECASGYTGLRCQIQLSSEFRPDQMLHLADAADDSQSSSLTDITFILSLRGENEKAVILYTNSANKISLYTDNGTLTLTLLGVGFSLHCTVDITHQITLVSIQFTAYSLNIRSKQLLNTTLSSADDSSCTRSTASRLDIRSPLYIGTLHINPVMDVWRNVIGYSNGFTGCISNLTLDGDHVSLSDHTPSGLALDPPLPTPGCSRDDVCTPDSCLNGGSCSGLWDSFECVCTDTFSGSTCSEGESITLDGSVSAVTLQLDPLLHPTVYRASVSLRTRDTGSTMLHAVYGTGAVIIAVNNDGKLELRIQTVDAPDFVLAHTRLVNTGVWVDVSLVIDRQVSLTADGISITKQWSRYQWLDGEVVDVYVGAALYQSGVSQSLVDHFSGCMRSLSFSDQPVNLQQPVSTAGVTSTTHSILPGCHGTQVCSEDTCPVNSYCMDEWNQFRCLCEAGWHGVDCSESVDDCIGVDCNHGSCEDEHLTSRCDCQIGYTGDFCEIEILACDSSPCHSNHTSECLNTPPLLYNCVCLPGYRGDICDLDIDECDSSPCLNDGQCNNLINRFSCDCVSGWEGQTCQINSNECLSSPCVGNSQCVDEMNGYTCVCSPGLTGSDCSIDISECSDDPCQFDSVCTEPQPGTYECACPDHLEGVHCDLVNSVSMLGSAHLQFQPIRSSQNGDIIIQFSFTTVQVYDSQLLIYAMNAELYQSLVLELIDSKLSLHLSTGSDIADLVIPLQSGTDGIINQQITVTMRQQTGSVQLQLGSTDSTATQIGGLRELNLNSTTFIGGIPYHTPFTQSQIISDSPFIGCFSDYIINSQPISLLLAPAANDSGVALGCQRVTQCQADSCNYHGSCLEMWTGYTCRCDEGYRGDRCDDLQVVEFSADNLLYIPIVTTVTHIQLEFSMNPAGSNSGVIFYTLPTSSTSAISVSASGNNISVALLSVGISLQTDVNIGKVTDGSWCTLELDISPDSHTMAVICEDLTASSSASHIGTTVEINGALYLGAYHSDNSANLWRQRSGEPTGAISGCARNLMVNNVPISFSSSTPTPHGSDPAKPLPGCSRDIQCGTSDRCSQYGQCVSNWTNHSCQCQLGFAGDTCETGVPLTYDGVADYSTISIDLSRFYFSSGSFSFRTREQQGTLLHILSDTQYIELELVTGGQLQVSTPTQTLTTTTRLNDAQWYTVNWVLSPLILITINSTVMERLQFRQGWEIYRDESVTLYVGAKGTSTGSRPSNYFKGCMSPLELSDHIITPSSLPAGVSYSSQGVVSGCHSDNQCESAAADRESAALCPQNADCVDLWNDYSCTCKDGWTGSGCSASVDDCIGHDCVSGQCVDGHMNYTCLCDTGYEGQLCDSVITLCTIEPEACNAANTERCIDVFPLNYTCECRAGWSGRYCDVEINECDSSPCQNNADCIDQINGFSCICPDDYFGALCESRYICASSPCNNGAICIPSDDNSLYVCRCTEQYLGASCDVYNSCYQNDCEHGSACLSDSLNRVYSCECTQGYYGNYCELTDYCHRHRCQNSADCVNMGSTYRCLCNQHYTGEFCSVVRDKCMNHSCTNGAACFFDSRRPESDYTCTCSPGYSGALCELEINECISSPCINGGDCVDLIARYDCDCAVGWSGDNCEVNVNECSSTPCLNGGFCFDQIDGYTCSCRPGYEGEICDLDNRGCRSSPCLNSATCISEGGNSYSCQCSDGFDGPLCERNIDDCVNNLCQFGSTCLDGLQGYACECLPGYSGQYCTEKHDSCYNTPCKNGGLCSYIGLCTCPDVNQLCGFHDESCQRTRCNALVGCSLRDVSYECDCSDTSYGGDQCDIDINECTGSTHSCKHGSRCINERGGYSCECQNTGFTGEHCHIDVDECSGLTGSRRCLNGATCINHPGWYTCICLDGWAGEDCDTDIQECSSNPCTNNSTCVEGVNGFICLCSDGYQGRYCTDNINECVISLQSFSVPPMCGESGSCVDTVGSYYCICPDGNTGRDCESTVNTSPSITPTDITTSPHSSVTTINTEPAVTEPRVAGPKYNVALVATLTILGVLLLCAVVILILYRHQCITPLPMKGSYRPESMSNLPMSVQYNPNRRQLLI